jgi:serine/threonine protein phosphatase PrpC
MTLTLRYAAQSDRGLIRDLNQDSVYAGPRLLAVADGMGGMAAGDVASNIVIAAMAPLDEDVPGDAMVDALRHAVGTANQHLRDTVDANPQLEGMGTTLTAVLFSGSKFGMVHIGDSRAYLLRNGEFAQITKDDTYVQMLVDEGRVSPEEASSHPQRSLLTRALDGRDIDPEYSVRQVLKGDRYLICSDGLSGVVSADTIGQTMREIADPQACVERLVQLALRGGGPDNITVVIADATDADIVEQAPIVGGAASLDRGNTTVADSSTPAARASALHAAAGAQRVLRPRAGAEGTSGPHESARTGPAGRARRWPLAGLPLHAAPVLRRRHRRRPARHLPGRARPDRRPGPVQRQRDQRRPAGRPDDGCAGAGQAGHPRGRPARRAAPAGRADRRRPVQPQPQAAVQRRRHRAHRNRVDEAVDHVRTEDSGTRDCHLGTGHAGQYAGRSGLGPRPAGRRSGRVPVRQLSTGSTRLGIS